MGPFRLRSRARRFRWSRVAWLILPRPWSVQAGGRCCLRWGYSAGGRRCSRWGHSAAVQPQRRRAVRVGNVQVGGWNSLLLNGFHSKGHMPGRRSASRVESLPLSKVRVENVQLDSWNRPSIERFPLQRFHARPSSRFAGRISPARQGSSGKRSSGRFESAVVKRFPLEQWRRRSRGRQSQGCRSQRGRSRERQSQGCRSQRGRSRRGRSLRCRRMRDGACRRPLVSGRCRFSRLRRGPVHSNNLRLMIDVSIVDMSRRWVRARF